MNEKLETFWVSTSMRKKVAILWAVALLLITLCVLFPERRQTFTGGSMPRKYLFSAHLYDRPNQAAGLLVEIDFARTLLKCMLVGTVTGIITIGLKLKDDG